MNVGITGQNGFVGWHLRQFLILKGDIKIIPFDRKYFGDPLLMEKYVAQCDVIIHLAAINRHENASILYETNVNLVKVLLEACANHKPKIYLSSSSQESNGSLYGNSKKESWRLLKQWGRDNDRDVGSFVIPNVFGPFGKPNYNSFIATFCNNIVNGKEVKIITDSEVNLIHVHDLVKEIWALISRGEKGRMEIDGVYKIKVSKVFEILDSFKSAYLKVGVIPDLSDRFKLQLFNLFRTYIPSDHFPVHFTQHSDDRGSFVEIVRANTSGQFSFSTTVPGITRGNHFHTRKAERFAVIKGRARIQLRKVGTDEVINYELDGEHPSYVDMPIWYTHNITNIGSEELVTLFWINEPYNPEDADTYFLDVE